MVTQTQAGSKLVGRSKMTALNSKTIDTECSHETHSATGVCEANANQDRLPVRVRRVRVGDRVRIRATADNPYAGCEGVVAYVGRNVCDVKLQLGKRMRKSSELRDHVDPETVYETVPKIDLESTNRYLELIGLAAISPAVERTWQRWVVSGTMAVAAVAVVAIVAWLWVLH